MNLVECDRCKAMPEIRSIAEGEIYQVVCPRCGQRGSMGRTKEESTINWNCLMHENRLNPCTECARLPIVIYRRSKGYAIRCTTCGNEIQGKSIDKLIEKWNKGATQ